MPPWLGSSRARSSLGNRAAQMATTFSRRQGQSDCNLPRAYLRNPRGCPRTKDPDDRGKADISDRLTARRSHSRQAVVP